MGAYGSPQLGDFTEKNKKNNKLTNCKTCGAEIAKSAKKCPHCGAKNKNGCLSGCLTSILIFIVLCAIAMMLPTDETNNQQNNDTPANVVENADNNTSVASEKEVEPVAMIEEQQEEKNQKETNKKSKEFNPEEYKSQCVNADYIEISRNPDSHKGEFAKFTGKVIQVQETWGTTVLRVATKQVQYLGYAEDIIYVVYKPQKNEARILENDKITVYGELNGIKNYLSVLGQQVSIPNITAKIIENQGQIK